MLKNKGEVVDFLLNFETYAHYDGEKFYLALETEIPKGILTIMKSQDGNFYYHRKNERYWDLKEIFVDWGILSEIIWAFRAAVSKSIKEMAV